MKNQYKVKTITCQCGKTVTGRLRPHQIYCSLECYRNSPKPARKTGEYRACKVCGTNTWITRSRLDKGDNFFCSFEHASEYQGRNKTSHICKICGKSFRWSPSRSKAYNIMYCSIPCRDADPERNEMLIALNAKQQRMSPNHIETIGYNLLTELGIEYEPQYLIGEKFCVDAFIPSLNTVIQFDGDYWHFNPAKFKEPDSRQQKRIKLDQSQDAYMRACGYTVIRIWASDLEKHLDHVKTRLQSLLVPALHMPVAQE